MRHFLFFAACIFFATNGEQLALRFAMHIERGSFVSTLGVTNLQNGATGARQRLRSAPPIQSDVRSVQTDATSGESADAEPQPIVIFERRPTMATVQQALAPYPHQPGSGYEGLFGYWATLEWADLNKDHEADLIVSDHAFFAVFLWLDGAYRLRHVERVYGKYNPASRHWFEDWTGDGAPEVVFEHKSDIGGTGIYNYNIGRTIIHCGAADCWVAFYTPLIAHTRETDLGGSARWTAQPSVDTTNGRAQITVRKRGYSFYNDGYYMQTLDESEVGALQVYTDTLVTYRWTGETFQFVAEEVIAPASIITATMQLTATSRISTVATLQVTRLAETVPSYRNDRCQLFIDQAAVGASLGCKRDFATIHWQDVLGSAEEELIVRVWSGGFHPNGDIIEASYCAHERVVIYQLIRAEPVEVANISGCMLLAQQEQITFVDLDEDGQLEIIRPILSLNERCVPIPRHDQKGEYVLRCWTEEQTLFDLFAWRGDAFVQTDAGVSQEQLDAPTPRDVLLTQFPLEIGLQRIYSVTYTTSNVGARGIETLQWHGYVTESIVGMHQDGSQLIFEAALDNYPYIAGDGTILTTQNVTRTYVVSNLGVQDGSGRWIIRHPLADGVNFAVFEDLYDPAMPCWYGFCVNAQSAHVAVPAGWFADCFRLEMWTGPDTTQRTVCEGVGMVEFVGWHHGPPDDYRWALATIAWP